MHTKNEVKFNMKSKKTFNDLSAPSADNVTGNPDTCREMVTRYGTYNIQATADTQNLFPTIAQGLVKQKPKHDNKKNP